MLVDKFTGSSYQLPWYLELFTLYISLKVFGSLSLVNLPGFVAIKSPCWQEKIQLLVLLKQAYFFRIPSVIILFRESYFFTIVKALDEGDLPSRKRLNHDTQSCGGLEFKVMFTHFPLAWKLVLCFNLFLPIRKPYKVFWNQTTK